MNPYVIYLATAARWFFGAVLLVAGAVKGWAAIARQAHLERLG